MSGPIVEVDIGVERAILKLLAPENMAPVLIQIQVTVIIRFTDFYYKTAATLLLLCIRLFPTVNIDF